MTCDVMKLYCFPVFATFFSGKRDPSYLPRHKEIKETLGMTYSVRTITNTSFLPTSNGKFSPQYLANYQFRSLTLHSSSHLLAYKEFRTRKPSDICDPSHPRALARALGLQHKDLISCTGLREGLRGHSSPSNTKTGMG